MECLGTADRLTSYLGQTVQSAGRTSRLFKRQVPC